MANLSMRQAMQMLEDMHVDALTLQKCMNNTPEQQGGFEHSVNQLEIVIYNCKSLLEARITGQLRDTQVQIPYDKPLGRC
jgi:hypothetical protein